MFKNLCISANHGSHTSRASVPHSPMKRMCTGRGLRWLRGGLFLFVLGMLGVVVHPLQQQKHLHVQRLREKVDGHGSHGTERRSVNSVRRRSAQAEDGDGTFNLINLKLPSYWSEFRLTRWSWSWPPWRCTPHTPAASDVRLSWWRGSLWNLCLGQKKHTKFLRNQAKVRKTFCQISFSRSLT